MSMNDIEKRLLELNGISKAVEGQEINKEIRKNGITISNELAIIRKQVLALCEALNIEPLTEFTDYCNNVEACKTKVKEEM